MNFVDRAEELAVYLSWDNTPAKTMMIQWHTTTGGLPSSYVEYRKQGEKEWLRKKGSRRAFPDFYRSIHWVELNGLDSGEIYEFRLREKIHTFKTPAENPQELKIAIGGDYQVHFYRWSEMSKTIGTFSPDFHVAIGDLASCDGVDGARWIEFFERIPPNLVDDDGHLIPLIVGLGNHDVDGGYGTKEDAPFYYSMFSSFNGNGYGSLNFGDLLKMLILDTGHTNTVKSQTQFVKDEIADGQTKAHTIPILHVAPYPASVTKQYDRDRETEIRDEWSTEFEKDNNVHAVFDGHNHCWGKTIDLGNNTRYFGGGTLGVGGAECYLPEDTWYLEDSAGHNRNPEKMLHFYFITVTESNINVKAVTIEGEVFDEVNIN